MSLHHIRLHTPVPRTFRTLQVAGLFDVPLDERLTHELTAEVPGLAEPWTIGAIVGPSGSGKTTIARAAFGPIYEPPPWPDDLPIIEVLDSAPTLARSASEGSGFGSQAEQDILARSASEGNPRSLFHDGGPTERPPPSPSLALRASVPLKDLTRLLTAVGLGSVPAWLKPYRVLSTGERFRADVARAIAGAWGWGLGTGERELASAGDHFHLPPLSPQSPAPNPFSPLVLDEFTSTLDRTVARTASAAIAKLLRRESTPLSPQSPAPIPVPPRLVVLSCHTDILPWLSPDWTLDLAGDPQTGGPRLTWGRLRRPTIKLAVRRVPQAVWPQFARHHYLSGGLASSATCYGAFIDKTRNDSASFNGEPQATASVDQQHTVAFGSALNEFSDSRSPTPDSSSPVAFCAVVAALGWKGRKRITRLVTLPEFQGLGIGPRLAEVVAADQAARGHRVSITASHPAILGHCSRSPRWRYVGLKKTGSTPQRLGPRPVACSTGRAVASFEFIAEGAEEGGSGFGVRG